MPRFVDLSHTVEHGMATYPGLPGPVIGDHLSRADSAGRYAAGTTFQIGRVELVSNTGTYVDAPFHRYADGSDLADLDLASLAHLPAIVCRVPAGVRAVGPDRFAGIEVTGRAVLVHTGWDRHWRTPAYQRGHPFLTRAAAEALRDRGAALVGIDSLNIDDTADGARPVHTILLAAGIPVVEHLRGLDAVPDEGFRFYAVPVKLRGVGSFPVRAFGLLDRQHPHAGERAAAMTLAVGAEHDFHDPAYAAHWGARFERTPGRLALFDLMLAELRSRIPPAGHILELGIGPGHLAAYLLDALPAVRYQGVDFSRPMLDIAARRLRAHAGRVAFSQTDLVADPWWRDLAGPVDAVVSTWALHDLGAPAHVERVYAVCAKILGRRGLLLNGDFIKPAGAVHEYEPGRFEIATHLVLLRRAGFAAADCLRVFEEELEAPTAAHNYACFRASRGSRAAG